MQRYNHRLIERKWLQQWAQASPADGEGSVCAVTIPDGSGCLALEAVRLLILADFFRLLAAAPGQRIYWLTPQGTAPQGIWRLGLPLKVGSPPGGKCDLLVIPRDFLHLLVQPVTCPEKLLCGRFFGTACLTELLADFGADALRIYFLYLGPPKGDYQFCWHKLAAAYRFVERVWNLAHNAGAASCPRWENQLVLVEHEMGRRLQQRKPHTALAAVMGFLKDKRSLAEADAIKLACLLKPYMPFLAAEIMSAPNGARGRAGK